VTFTEPVAGNVPRPLTLTEVALVVLQLSVVEAPLVTVPGEALNAMAGTCWAVDIFCVAIEPPPQPMVAIKAVNKKTNAGVRRENRKKILLLIKSAKRLEGFPWFQFKQPQLSPASKNA